MAVTIKNSMNGLAAIKKIGVPQYLYDWLVVSLVDVKLTASMFEFSYLVAGVVTTHNVAVDLDQLLKLNAGTLPSTAKLSLANSITAELINVQKSVEAHGDLVSMTKVNENSALGQLPPLKAKPAPKSEVNVTAGYGLWSVFDLSKLKTAPTIKLRDATQMYQPVGGTSGGSRYYMVAGNDDIRIAARYKGTTLSMRVEGPKISNHTNAIKACWGGECFKGDYASLHLEVANDILANKTLGAILLGLGVPLDTPLPNLKVIKA